MIINTDGSFMVEEGDVFPFICPRCAWPIPFDEKLFFVMCPRCHFGDIADEFFKGNIQLIG